CIACCNVRLRPRRRGMRSGRREPGHPQANDPRAAPMHQSPTPMREFRTDIAGLRAVAGICVGLFHFDVPGWRGGFPGVAIFFVISGFLMTMLVVQDIERGRFSVWSFYLARARRIMPALLCVCAVLLAAGALWLTPPDYDELAQQSAWAALFASNF